ncbi:MAG: hypothetical protein ACRDRP_07945 [Pseudonocardiaceae bacterium]
MVRVVNVQRQQLERRRAEILARHGVTLDEFAERAVRYELVGDEWDAWGSCAASPSCSAMPDDSADGTGSSTSPSATSGAYTSRRPRKAFKLPPPINPACRRMLRSSSRLAHTGVGQLLNRCDRCYTLPTDLFLCRYMRR